MTMIPANDERPLLLRVDEAAALLGISRSHTYELISAGALPVVRMGKSVRIGRAALERWVEQEGSAGSLGRG
jgi:excisionase family DNA binding protein